MKRFTSNQVARRVRGGSPRVGEEGSHQDREEGKHPPAAGSPSEDDHMAGHWHTGPEVARNRVGMDRHNGLVEARHIPPWEEDHRGGVVTGSGGHRNIRDEGSCHGNLRDIREAGCRHQEGDRDDHKARGAYHTACGSRGIASVPAHELACRVESVRRVSI